MRRDVLSGRHTRPVPSADEMHLLIDKLYEGGRNPERAEDRQVVATVAVAQALMFATGALEEIEQHLAAIRSHLEQRSTD